MVEISVAVGFSSRNDNLGVSLRFGFWVSQSEAHVLKHPIVSYEIGRGCEYLALAVLPRTTIFRILRSSRDHIFWLNHTNVGIA